MPRLYTKQKNILANSVIGFSLMTDVHVISFIKLLGGNLFNKNLIVVNRSRKRQNIKNIVRLNGSLVQLIPKLIES